MLPMVQLLYLRYSLYVCTQDDNQGGGLPTIKNQENAPPGGSVVEQPEDDGQQEDSSEGAETAGPLT